MTQYETILWMDSDTLVVRLFAGVIIVLIFKVLIKFSNVLRSFFVLYNRSLHHLLSLENKLIRPGSGGPGPRIGASYDGEYYRYLLNKGMTPPAGSVDDDINTGVFIIKPDREEFLNLINMKISKGIKVRRSTPGEQGWLN